MIKKANKNKIMFFWILPFLAGAGISVGYLLTHRVFSLKNKYENKNLNLGTINKEFTKGIEHNKETKVTTNGKDKKNSNLNQNNVIKTTTSTKSSSPADKTRIEFNKLGSNLKKSDQVENEIFRDNARFEGEAQSDINKVIFKKLFETLPKP